METERTDRERQEPGAPQIEQLATIIVCDQNIKSQISRGEECEECGATLAHYSHCIRYA